MSFIDAIGKPESGLLPLQHKDYDANKWSLDYRAHKRVVRVIERDDSSGAYQLDPDATGDLVLGYCWPQDGGQREMPMWSFSFPVVLEKGGKKDNSVPTPGAGASFSGVATLIPGGAPGGGDGGKSDQMSMRPIKDQKYKPDTRMKPIPAPPRILEANGPQNPNAAPAGAGAGAGGGARNPNQVDSGSQTLYLGIGAGAVQQGFGGSGVGFGGRSGASFGGVRTDWTGGSPGATFPGVRNNFSSGSSQAGATFIDPTAGPKKGS